MTKVYKISPDYTASGVWTIDTGYYVSADLPDYVPETLRIALKYWCHIWEYFVTDSYGNWNATDSYIKSWDIDGKKIVDELNLLGVDTYIYDVDVSTVP